MTHVLSAVREHRANNNWLGMLYTWGLTQEKIDNLLREADAWFSPSGVKLKDVRLSATPQYYGLTEADDTYIYLSPLDETIEKGYRLALYRSQSGAEVESYRFSHNWNSCRRLTSCECSSLDEDDEECDYCEYGSDHCTTHNEYH